MKNKQQQSAYDIAESHLVRQYLLPLVLQAERGGDMGIPPPPPVVMTSQPMGGMSVAGNNALGNYSYNASVPAPAPHQSSFPSFNNKQQLPTLSTAYPPATTSSAPASNIQVPAFAPPPHTYSALQTNRGATTTSNSGSGRIIQPGEDNFCTCSNDIYSPLICFYRRIPFICFRSRLTAEVWSHHRATCCCSTTYWASYELHRL